MSYIIVWKRISTNETGRCNTKYDHFDDAEIAKDSIDGQGIPDMQFEVVGPLSVTVLPGDG